MSTSQPFRVGAGSNWQLSLHSPVPYIVVYTDSMIASGTQAWVWTLERHLLFHTCPRKYFYTYYAHRIEDEHRRQEVQFLRSLKNRFEWVTEATLNAISKAIGDRDWKGATDKIQCVENELVQVLRQQYKSSLKVARAGAKDATPVLFEHVYQVPVADAEWKHLVEGAQCWLRAFFTSELWQQIFPLVGSETFQLEPRLQSMVSDGVSMTVRVGAIVKTDNRGLVYQWNPKWEPNTAEMWYFKLAAFCIEQTDRLPASAIEGWALAMASSQLARRRGTEDNVSTVREFVLDSLDEMQFLLLDLRKDIPLPEEEFLFTDDVRRCSCCNYVKVCPKWSHTFERNGM